MQADQLRVIKLTGSAFNRGRIHGEELRADIQKQSDVFSDALERVYRVPADQYLNDFMAYQNFMAAITRYCPHLLEEVRGIAAGAGLPFNKILLLQLTDEEWVFGRTLWSHRQNIQHRSKCTAFGFHDARRGITYAGQNMDIPPFHEGRQVVFHICHEHSDLESFVFATAGGLGFMGVNNSPLGVCCNTLMELPSCNDGLPVAFVLRGLLECTSYKAAVDFLRFVRHASGQNYLLSAAGGIGTFECSAEGVVEVVSPSHSHWICHTNHVLGNHGRLDAQGGADLAPHKLRNSQVRLSSMVSRIAEFAGNPTIEGFKSTLSACDDPLNPVSRKLAGASVDDVMSYTAGSAIYEMGHVTKLHIAPGPPCESAFRTLQFEKQAGAR